ncbi:MAG: hypothetical protein GWP10_22220 [Nitrospiraceae bacterium]|nr:hypothetical protein [Nitrospiraceae bacterium]
MRRKVKALHFKSKEDYKKWLAYGHMHVKNFGKRPRPRVYVRGKLYKIKR